MLDSLTPGPPTSIRIACSRPPPSTRASFTQRTGRTRPVAAAVTRSRSPSAPRPAAPPARWLDGHALGRRPDRPRRRGARHERPSALRPPARDHHPPPRRRPHHVRRHVPGRSFARALAEWLTPAARSGWRDLPASVTATTGTSPDGRRVHIVHNWRWEPASVPAPVDFSDALTGAAVPAGSTLQLGPWDVRVVVSADA